MWVKIRSRSKYRLLVKEPGRIPGFILPVSTLVAGQAAGPSCDQGGSAAVGRLIGLIAQLQADGVALAIPGAGLGYTIAGLMWLSGLPEYQRTARTMFIRVTIGLIIVLLAGPLVDVIRGPLCGGGG
jgi:hypothetical protein